MEIVGLFDEMLRAGHEQLLTGVDPDSGYRGIIAIHSTRLGPAVGGTRVWKYATDGEAVRDALRLSRAMTYKSAIAGLPTGGGKSVIFDPGPRADREALFRFHGKMIQSLGGRYITAEDVGTNVADMDFILRETNWVAGLAAKSGDPSVMTGYGVFRAIQAGVLERFGEESLNGIRVAIQGCGNVGHCLAGHLSRAGAILTVADLDQARARRVVEEFGASQVDPNAIHEVDAEVFSPCALGGIINDRTIPRLTAMIVAGGANNQLLENRHGDMLDERGILYAPDYVANGGGVINGVCIELLGWDRARTEARVSAIHETMLRVFEYARANRVPTYLAADRLAEERLRAGVSADAI